MAKPSWLLCGLTILCEAGRALRFAERRGPSIRFSVYIAVSCSRRLTLVVFPNPDYAWLDFQKNIKVTKQLIEAGEAGEAPVYFRRQPQRLSGVQVRRRRRSKSGVDWLDMHIRQDKERTERNQRSRTAEAIENKQTVSRSIRCRGLTAAPRTPPPPSKHTI